MPLSGTDAAEATWVEPRITGQSLSLHHPLYPQHPERQNPASLAAPHRSSSSQLSNQARCPSLGPDISPLMPHASGLALYALCLTLCALRFTHHRVAIGDGAASPWDASRSIPFAAFASPFRRLSNAPLLTHHVPRPTSHASPLSRFSRFFAVFVFQAPALCLQPSAFIPQPRSIRLSVRYPLTPLLLPPFPPHGVTRALRHVNPL